MLLIRLIGLLGLMLAGAIWIAALLPHKPKESSNQMPIVLPMTLAAGVIAIAIAAVAVLLCWAFL